jgi:hypothetical protein
MVPLIARQSVIIKCNMQKSVMTGNYEFYYGAGLVEKFHKLGLSGDTEPMQLREQLEEKLASLTPGDEKEKYLWGMLLGYKLEENYDEQMKEMFVMGREEQHLWSVTA